MCLRAAAAAVRATPSPWRSSVVIAVSLRRRQKKPDATYPLRGNAPWRALAKESGDHDREIWADPGIGNLRCSEWKVRCQCGMIGLTEENNRSAALHPRRIKKRSRASLEITPMYHAVISDLVQHHDERRAWLDRDPN
jgi:hypothetical protein